MLKIWVIMKPETIINLIGGITELFNPVLAKPES